MTQDVWVKGENLPVHIVWSVSDLRSHVANRCDHCHERTTCHLCQWAEAAP